LENVLGQIEADGGNVHGGWLLLLVVYDGNHTLAPGCREREPSTPSVPDPQWTLRGMRMIAENGLAQPVDWIRSSRISILIHRAKSNIATGKQCRSRSIEC